VHTRAELVAALFSESRVSVGELARELEASVFEIDGFYSGLRHLGIVDRIGDADGGTWERTAQAPSTPLATQQRIEDAGIDVTVRLRRVEASG
jgi:hypothetical protein